jgi:hypothetical protein
MTTERAPPGAPHWRTRDLVAAVEARTSAAATCQQALNERLSTDS